MNVNVFYMYHSLTVVHFCVDLDPLFLYCSVSDFAVSVTPQQDE